MSSNQRNKEFSPMDQELTGRGDNRKLQQRVTVLTAGLGGALIVILALLAGLIAIGVEQTHQKDRFDSLRREVNLGSRQTSNSASSRATPISNDAASTAQSALIVDNPAEVRPGFKLVGHLFEGTGYWTQLRDMIYSRSDHSVVPVDDMVYILGGVTDNRTKITILDALTAYDTQTNTMIVLEPMPSSRYRFSAAELSGKIYVMGGYTAAPIDPVPDNKSPTTDIYDVAAHRWSKGANLVTARSDGCAAEVDGKIYMVGGWDSNWVVLGNTEVYDPLTAKWTAVASMNRPRGDLACVSLNGKLYTIGGYGETGYEGTVEEYDPKTNVWVVKSPMKHPRGDFAAVGLTGGRILTMGGEIQTLGKNMTTFADINVTQVATHRVEEYIIKDDIWVQLAPLPEARFRSAAASILDQVYIFGGTPTCQPDKNLPACDKVGLKTVYAYLDVPRPNVYIMVKE